MRETKYGIKIQNTTLTKELNFLTNQIYKLLPLREEGGDWKKALNSIIFEVNSIYMLFELSEQDTLFPLLFKLEGLRILFDEKDFLLFRKTIFECLSVIGEVKMQCLDTNI